MVYWEMPPLPQAPEVLQWVFRSYVLFAKRALTPQQDLDCLQQATADQAFTNAKAAGDVAVSLRAESEITQKSK